MGTCCTTRDKNVNSDLVQRAGDPTQIQNEV